jgi:hypothetical protein
MNRCGANVLACRESGYEEDCVQGDEQSKMRGQVKLSARPAEDSLAVGHSWISHRPVVVIRRQDELVCAASLNPTASAWSWQCSGLGRISIDGPSGVNES